MKEIEERLLNLNNYIEKSDIVKIEDIKLKAQINTIQIEIINIYNLLCQKEA